MNVCGDIHDKAAKHHPYGFDEEMVKGVRDVLELQLWSLLKTWPRETNQKNMLEQKPIPRRIGKTKNTVDSISDFCLFRDWCMIETYNVYCCEYYIGKKIQ